MTVAWLYPTPDQTFWMSTRNFTFGAGNANWDFFEHLPNSLQELLDDWVNQFGDFLSLGGSDISGPGMTPGLKGYAIPHQAAAANIDLLTKRLDKVLTDLAALSGE